MPPGIAYNDARALRIYKRPLPGHRMRFHLPSEARFLMGHTRMATQGSAHRNHNNHPFPGRAGGLSFALAHNGVLHNDRALRRQWKLPESSIETDSYVAVQLLERQGGVSFTDLRFMAEQMEGSFTFTVLDRSDTMSIVKGDNPFCLYHYPREGLYLYASTEAILQQALRRMPGKFGLRQTISVACGEILKIAADGTLTPEPNLTMPIYGGPRRCGGIPPPPGDAAPIWRRCNPWPGHWVMRRRSWRSWLRRVLRKKNWKIGYMEGCWNEQDEHLIAGAWQTAPGPLSLQERSSLCSRW